MGDQVPAESGDLLAETAGIAPGSRVGGYRLEERIGQGGMAVVFRAVDERLDRRVALKVLAPALAADEGFRQRFIRESRAAAAVDNPHVIPVFEAGEADGILFIVMRYVPGGDARTLVQRDGPLPVGRAAAIISPVASALDSAHAAGLVHRDVKPANILVDTGPGRPDHVYLSDFGLSKGSLAVSRLTGTGQFLGTLDYIAPEQIDGKPADGRADEYALACSAFELLAGVPPFRRDEVSAMIWAHMAGQPPPLTERRPDLPPEVDGVMAKALAKAPGDRYSTCREFADAMREALGLAPYASGPAVMSAAPAPPARLGSPKALVPVQEGTLAASAPDSAAAPPDALAAAPPDTGTDLRTEVPAPQVSAPGSEPGADLLTVTADSPASSATAQGPATLAARGRRSRTAPAIAVAAVAVAIVGLVIWAPWVRPPVLRPGSLLANAATTSSVAFSWSSPRTGPLPDRYLIFQDGDEIGSVPGTVTSYSGKGLAPATTYDYRVAAVRDGQRSARSPVIAVTTVTPPVSAAVLFGPWTVSYTGLRWSGFTSAPTLTTDIWTFGPDCTTELCSVTLSGQIQGLPFTAVLHRSGAVYTGTAPDNNYTKCNSTPAAGSLTLKIQVSHAEAIGTLWEAASWAGTMAFHSPATANCTASEFSVSLSSTF
jgi:hypothetical protein